MTAETPDFTTVTELSGDEVTEEQVNRIANRYMWAARYCEGKDILEVACGTGQGLGLLASVGRSLHAGDISPELAAMAEAHYKGRIKVSRMDAQNLPFGDACLDVVILFEAIYYLPEAELFVAECARVLRPGGTVLISTANKDLFDFNPSPYSHRYFGVVELGQLFGARGFSCEFFGATPVTAVSFRQRLLRPIKAIIIRLDLMPKTMAGKKLLKRLAFGGLVAMPAEVTASTAPYEAPDTIPAGVPNQLHKVILSAAKLPG